MDSCELNRIFVRCWEENVSDTVTWLCLVFKKSLLLLPELLMWLRWFYHYTPLQPGTLFPSPPQRPHPRVITSSRFRIPSHTCSLSLRAFRVRKNATLCMSACLCVYVCEWVCVSMCAYVSVCVLARARPCLCVYVCYLFVCVCVWVRVHARARVCQHQNNCLKAIRPSGTSKHTPKLVEGVPRGMTGGDPLWRRAHITDSLH